MLEAPPTLRLAKAYEVPKRPEILTRIKQGQEANIIEGFTIQQNDTHELPFSFYAEINVDNSRLWQLFVRLGGTLPEPVSCLYGFYEEEPVYGEYQPSQQVIAGLEKLSSELAQDCYLEFGLIHQTDKVLVEIFVDNSKYLKYWGVDETAFRQLLDECSIPEVAALNFYDEFPKVVVPLVSIRPDLLSTEQIINALKVLFP